ncbi:MAG: hypothetical protein JJV99_09560 [Colwellia sp.]|nr:hypothetical protein [Colwellia sp.]
MGHDSTGIKRAGLVGAGAGLATMFLPFMPGGTMAKVGGALFGGLVGDALFSKEYQIPDDAVEPIQG